MNALVRSSPAHAFQCTVWPRALAITSSQVCLVWPGTALEKRIDNAPTQTAAARRVRPRTISDSDRGQRDFSGSGLWREPFGSTATRTRLLEHRTQLFFVESITADTQVLIGRAVGKLSAACFDEACFGPAISETHALRVPHRDGFIGGHAGQGVEDFDQRILEQVADREFGLDAAWI